MQNNKIITKSECCTQSSFFNSVLTSLQFWQSAILKTNGALLTINKQLDTDLSVNNGLAKAWRLHWLTFHMVRIQGSVLAQSNYKLNAGWHLPLLPWETWTEHLVSPLTEGKNNLATGWFWLRYKRSLGSWKSKKSWGSSLSYPGKIKR